MSGKPVVLILEDLPNWQDTLQRSLDQDRYEIVVAGSLSVAISFLCSRVIDAAIVDIRLEEGDIDNTDGIAFLNELEKYYLEDRTHAVMLSGHATKELAIDALTRPSHIVLNFFLKEKLDVNRLIEEVARAVRTTQAERPMRADLPPSFLKAINLSDFVASLTLEADPSVSKDLKLLLRNLMLNMPPIAEKAKVDVEPTAGARGSGLHILCWSRRLAKALGVSVGQTETIEILRIGERWQNVGPAEEISHWSTQYFGGTVFDLPTISFDRFLSIVEPTS